MTRRDAPNESEAERLAIQTAGELLERDHPHRVAERARQAETINPHAPLDVAHAFLRDRYDGGVQRRLHFWAGDFYVWLGPRYCVVSQDIIRARLYEWLAERKDESGAPVRPTRRMVDNVLDALRAAAILEIARAPAWLEFEGPVPASEIVSCDNGLLHIITRELLPHTPLFFTLNAVEFGYDPDAPLPSATLAFLDQIFEGDAESIECLQEWCGYLLVPDTRQQKLLLVIGPPRSGKGTIGRVIRALVGADNCCSPTLSTLGLPFGLAGLLGKQVAIMSDARLSHRADLGSITENILRISGEDAVSVQRKFLPDWVGQLAARFVLLSNELPAFIDSSGALASRFILVQTRKSFLGREDPGLTERLLDELPGLLNWALTGGNRLRSRGHFQTPASSVERLRQLELLSSPIKAFLADRTKIEPGAEVLCSALFAAWCEWCAAQKRDQPGSRQIFGRNFSAAAPGVRVEQKRDPVSGVRHRWYIGIRLREAFEDE